METISLNGTWKLRWSTGQRGGSPYVMKQPDDSQHDYEMRGIPRPLLGQYRGFGWLDATVPGEVHLDLMRQGLLDDPRVGINVFKARWVEEMVWYYRRTFDAPENFQSKKVWLCFEELDLSAIIYLNGEEIARHENAFYPLWVCLDGKLLPENNELVVRIDSGLFNVCEKPIRDQYSAVADVGLLLTKRMWLRKPQYEAEWDWSPRLMNVGISGCVSLYAETDAVVTQCQLRQQVKEDLSTAELTARIFTAEPVSSEYHYQIEMTVDGQTVIADCAGEDLSVTIKIQNPKLWYPVGYGNQILYPVTVRLLRNGDEVYRKETKTGFRRVAVDQSLHPEKGNYFIVSVNNRPVFVKGSNFVPMSLYPAAVTAADYDRLTDRALEANMNMLRIWGGGLYEREDLFRICDEKGILLWQEFISACAYPPYQKDKVLYDSMLAEAQYQVRRLSGHPSLIVWCGNNELNPAGHPLYLEDYPRILQQEDPEKYYQPASPYNAFDPKYPESRDIWWEYSGDQHPWGVGFLEKDHRVYRQYQCRFPNEGGIMGPTNRISMRLICDDPNNYYGTTAFEAHDNMLAFMKEGTSPDQDLLFWTGIHPQTLPLEAYIAAGGYVQAEGLGDYIDNFRRRAWSTSSAIFWMLNDCWPCSRSWTILDDEGRRNPAFYHVKNAFAPIRLVLTQEGTDVAVWSINDTDTPLKATLTAGKFCSRDGGRTEETAEVELPPRRVHKLLTIPDCITPQENTGNIMVPYAQLHQDGKLITRNRLLTHRYFEYALEKPVISVSRQGESTVFTCDSYVMGVCLDLDGEAALSDNLFDLYPGVPYGVTGSCGEILSTMNDILQKYGE